MHKKKELADRPDFEVYAEGMNATMKLKWQDIGKHIVPGKIIDVGCGTGELTKIIALKFLDSQVVGLDISDHFVQLSRKNTNNLDNVEILQVDVISELLEPESITTKIFSSIMHELASYNEYDKEIPRKVINNAFEELKPGGRIIIRDGISPGFDTVYLWLNNENGMNELNPEKNLLMNFGELSTESRFIRFCMQFKGKKWDYKIIKINGKKLYEMNAHFANEFMSKKEYVENWEVEVLEEFGTYTIEEYKNIMEQAGFRLVEFRAYKNPWIIKNWYEKKLKVYKLAGEQLEELQYFPTNIMIVGEKSKKS